MRVLVTGASGFLGSAVVAALVENGYIVRCLVRSGSNVQRIQHLKWERSEGNILDKESVVKSAKNCQAIIHLAGTSDWEKITSQDMWATIVNGTSSVLYAAKKEHCQRVVFVSSMSAINGSDNPTLMNESTDCTLPKSEPAFEYIRAKQAAEKLCLDAVAKGLDVVIANPPETYGPDDIDLITAKNLIDLYKSNPVLVSKGGGLIGYIDDVAQAIVAVFTKGKTGERYVLGGNNNDFLTLVTTMFDILGEKRKIILMPTFIIRIMTALAVFFNIKIPYNPLIIPYATRYWYFDTSKSQKELGVKFRDLRETLKPTLLWLKKTGQLK